MSHTGLFFLLRLVHHLKAEINYISIDVWFGQYLKIWNLRVQKNLNIEKIIFKVVQIKFLAMHITNQKLSFDIFTSWNMILISNNFWNERQIYNFDPYNVLLVIATNIAVLLMTASVLQGHTYIMLTA